MGRKIYVCGIQSVKGLLYDNSYIFLLSIANPLHKQVEGWSILKKQEKMKEQTKQVKQDERQLIKDFANPENVQPVPQPKDFEDIEY